MHCTIKTTLQEPQFVRRLQQILGTDEYISEMNGNLPGYISLGSNNNVAYRKIEPGIYRVWIRLDVYPIFNTYLPAPIIEGLL